MKRIISVSRRTDVPAFYGQWFLNRIHEGFAGVTNPFGGKKHIISLKPEDVSCFVFWSKNFAPFLDNLKIIEKLGYDFYFNYTITALPSEFETNVNRPEAIEALKHLSRQYSPKHINWRFDPIIISSITDRDFYINSFKKLASQLDGLVERCYISFVTVYNKVVRNFAAFETANRIKFLDWPIEAKVDLANELADIAQCHGIKMYSCCGEYLAKGGNKIKKAHCIDGDLIEKLFYPDGFKYNMKPTRDECGCTQSSDIGTYDTCPHACIYCYANANKETALKRAKQHDAHSAFLGYNKNDSDMWIKQKSEKQQFEFPGCI
ncbi:MAG: DUF1848 domain-containing protein [Planctomycetes bacterium]|nr:DUF1848 domain-containing protein [Planctomycetota bacterium]